MPNLLIIGNFQIIKTCHETELQSQHPHFHPPIPCCTTEFARQDNSTQTRLTTTRTGRSQNRSKTLKSVIQTRVPVAVQFKQLHQPLYLKTLKSVIQTRVPVAVQFKQLHQPLYLKTLKSVIQTRVPVAAQFKQLHQRLYLSLPTVDLEIKYGRIES